MKLELITEKKTTLSIEGDILTIQCPITKTSNRLCDKLSDTMANIGIKWTTTEKELIEIEDWLQEEYYTDRYVVCEKVDELINVAKVNVWANGENVESWKLDNVNYGNSIESVLGLLVKNNHFNEHQRAKARIELQKAWDTIVEPKIVKTVRFKEYRRFKGYRDDFRIRVDNGNGKINGGYYIEEKTDVEEYVKEIFVESCNFNEAEAAQAISDIEGWKAKYFGETVKILSRCPKCCIVVNYDTTKHEFECKKCGGTWTFEKLKTETSPAKILQECFDSASGTFEKEPEPKKLVEFVSYDAEKNEVSINISGCHYCLNTRFYNVVSLCIELEMLDEYLTKQIDQIHTELQVIYDEYIKPNIYHEVKYDLTPTGLIVRCPHKKGRSGFPGLFIAVCSESCKGCDCFGGFNDVKKVVFCKHTEE